MSLMTTSEFENFFEPYAGNVEGFYQAAYWRLSDELIKELVRRHLGVTPGAKLLDAGGGTGRWGAWYATELQADVTIADKSSHMLDEARRVLTQVPQERRPRLVHCDLENAPELADEEFDAVVSTYGVLSFLHDPQAAFRTISRVLKPGGHGLLMSHSLSNALASKVNRDLADADEIDEILTTGTVRWSAHVPRLRVFSAEDLRALAAGAGLDALGVFGVTSVVQPGADDFGYPYDRISEISRRLEDPEYFRQALRWELAASERPEWAERGVNLMLHVVRPGR